jgi:hypothetical protein
MSMFGPKPGSWWLRSKSDPRWDADGRESFLVTAGPVSSAIDFVERKKAELGIDPPDDLEYGCMKD